MDRWSAAISISDTVAKRASPRCSPTKTASMPSSTFSVGRPASTRALHEMRKATPMAASSGPCPHTSPMSSRTVPSGHSMTSKKSPPSSASGPPGR